jgi:hypothetical protein
MADRPGNGAMKSSRSGARFEISVDGTLRTYRDTKEIALEAAELLKSRNPNSRSL